MKILKSVFLTVALPSFALMISFYVAWNFYVRGRIVKDLARSTTAIAGSIGSDLGVYDGMLRRLSSEKGLVRVFSEGGDRADLSATMRAIYAVMGDRKVTAVVRGIRADGQVLFSTLDRRPEDDDEAFDPQWGLYGLMERRPASVVGYRRSMGYGKMARTDYSLGKAVVGPDGLIVGYLIADLALQESKDLSLASGDGVTARFILTDEFDRVVASYDGSSLKAFDRFAIRGAEGETGIEGSRHAFARRNVGLHGLAVYGLASIEFILSSFRFGLYTIGVIILLFTAVFAIVLARSVRRMTRPMYDILSTMGKVSQGDFGARLDVISGDEFEEIAVRLNALIVEMESTVKRLMEGIAQAKAAEMKQLQAQFNPHFLYNTIDTAKWMMKMGETDKASMMLTNMAKVLRYSIHDRLPESTVALREDIQAIKTYLEIHKLSLGDRLSIEYDIDKEALSCRVPKLLIQPLVENALVHGIGATGSGRLSISVKAQGAKVMFSVADSGAGFAADPEALFRAEAVGEEGGMGISLVLRRARLQYGDDFSFDVRSGPGQGSVVVLTIPKETQAD
jgi:two-component system, sensor histidine kinase YesM